MNYRILELESSQLFAKQAKKTQVLITNAIHSDIYRTRQTHVYEVRTISEMIAKKIGFKKIEELSIVSMAHDIGHPPLGHKGAEMLDKIFKKEGLSEGFSDNNNNLQMIELNGLSFSDYEMVSLIKYPDKLYPEQKKKYLNMLRRYVAEEKVEYGENLKRTVACNIMDIADEIAYTTSDLYDSYSTGFLKPEDMSQQLNELAKKYKSNPKLFSVLSGIAAAAKNNYKRVIREEIYKLKIFFIEDTIWDYKLSNLTFKSDLSKKLLSDIFCMNYKFFIKNERVEKKRKKALKKLEKVVKYFLTCSYKDFPSDMYKEKYKIAKNRKEELQIIRDMISDTTDSFILNFKGK